MWECPSLCEVLARDAEEDIRQLCAHLMAFKCKRAIPKFLFFFFFLKIDSKDFERLKASPALIFLNLF